MSWEDNVFESLRHEDIKKIAQVEGIRDYNVITANTCANPFNFKRIEDADVDQSSDEQAVSLRENVKWNMILMYRMAMLW